MARQVAMSKYEEYCDLEVQARSLRRTRGSAILDSWYQAPRCSNWTLRDVRSFCLIIAGASRDRPFDDSRGRLLGSRSHKKEHLVIGKVPGKGMSPPNPGSTACTLYLSFRLSGGWGRCDYGIHLTIAAGFKSGPAKTVRARHGSPFSSSGDEAPLGLRIQQASRRDRGGGCPPPSRYQLSNTATVLICVLHPCMSVNKDCQASYVTVMSVVEKPQFCFIQIRDACPQTVEASAVSPALAFSFPL